MNTGAVNSKARELALASKFFVLTLLLFLLPQRVLAKTPDDQFKQYLINICSSQTIPAGWNLVSLSSMCQAAFPGGFASAGTTTTSSSNVGIAGAALETHRKKIGAPSGDQDDKSDKGASADGGGWGVLVTPQYSKNNRTDTDLENGYQSELRGLVVGLDYRFSDSLVLGGTIGHTKDDATFINNAGSLKTRNNTFTLYGTWLPSTSVSVDGYVGYGRLSLNNQRHVDFGLINGMIDGSTTGNQVLAGLSTSYQTDVGRFNVSPFFNLDYIKTRFRGYSESGSYNFDTTLGVDIGTDTLTLLYGDRRMASLTSSLGARVGTSFGYDWGALQPSASLAAVHEFQNNAQHISNELISTPGFSMSVATDAPDRNYLNVGFGVAAALNGGAQYFLNYEKRAQDRLLSSWALSIGGLVEF